MTLRWAGPVSLALMVVMLAAGCSASDSPAASQAAANSAAASPAVSVPVTSRASTVGAHYPIEAYTPSDLQQAELTLVTEHLVSACMGKLGFYYQPIKKSPSQYYQMTAKDSAETSSRTWGISDLPVAEEYGYQLPPWYTE